MIKVHKKIIQFKYQFLKNGCTMEYQYNTIFNFKVGKYKTILSDNLKSDKHINLSLSSHNTSILEKIKCRLKQKLNSLTTDSDCNGVPNIYLSINMFIKYRRNMVKQKISLLKLFCYVVFIQSILACIFIFHEDTLTKDTERRVVRTDQWIQTRHKETVDKYKTKKHATRNCGNVTCSLEETEERMTYARTKHVTSKCGNITCPLHLAQDDTWFSVNTERVAIIFSAYFVTKLDTIFLIGARVNRRSVKLTCQLWFLSEHVPSIVMEEVDASEKALSDNHNRYRSTFYKCSVPSNMRPTHVSMVTSSCRTPTNLIKLKYIDPTKDYSKNFTVCLMPLNYNYSRAYEMVEWIELNRILGADKFVIYNYSSAMNVERVLNYYSKLNLVEVVQWKIPLIVDTWPKSTTPEIHYFGQLAVLQDCLYRNKQESKYIVNVDIDEFIIPRGVNMSTWADIIQTFPNNLGAFIFRNTFFRKEWNDTKEEFPDKDSAKKYQLVSLLKTKHEKVVLPYGQRSKFIARTSAVGQIEVHDVSFLINNKVHVPFETGMLHHYRNWLKYDDPESVKVEDNIVVRKFAKSLIQNVAKVWKMLPNIPLDMHTV